MRILSAPEVRAAIAAHVCGAASPSERLGEIVLLPHQDEAVERVRRLLATRGGAVLADDVGLGKTFVALAVARDAAAPVVVAPAALRETWAEAARRAAVPVAFVSVESLSRRGAPDLDPDLVIVDEAHHLRSPATRRYDAARVLCRRARVLLLSATPVQNALDDLRSIVALFAGSAASAMTGDDLAGCIVRRVADDLPAGQVALPRVAAPEWLPAIPDADCLDHLLALPRAVPPVDGDDGGVLLTYTLMRQWASSRAALCAALRRRLARAFAMEDALLAGRMPTRAELTAWCFAEGAQQLAFPELAAATPADDGPATLAQVRRHAAAVRELLDWLGRTADPDVARVAMLRDLLHRRRGERVVAFSEYAETVSALYRGLAGHARVAMLTHAGGRVVSGPVTRRDVLERFAPGASARTPDRERIDLLLTTDVLSEGVNLQDASVLVHLDLCWNPARLEQRVGRLRRIGAARDSVHVYLSPPPAPAERVLQLEQRLRLKIGTAARALGVAGAILPGVPRESGSASRQVEGVARIVRGWRGADRAPDEPLPVAAAVLSRIPGALACVAFGDTASLVALVNGRVTEQRDVVEQLAAAAGGPGTGVRDADVRSARQLLESWLRRRIVSDVVSLPALRVAHTRRTLLHRVESISRRAPRHAQPQLAPLMRAARAAAGAVLSSGAEAVLDQLTRSTMADDAWLHAVGEFAALHARGPTTDAPRLLAMLLLVSPENG